MHYIRALKLAKYDLREQKFKTTITITTDLGETFLDEDAELLITISSSESDAKLLEQQATWTSGMRALPIEVDARGIPRAVWPLRLSIAHKALRGAVVDDLARLPAIVTLRSSELSLSPTVDSTMRVERHFTHASDTAQRLIIHEDAGDSIARHLWDGSLVLSSCLDTILAQQQTPPFPLLPALFDPDRTRSVNVIELGCGSGVVGIALAQMLPRATVLLTDLPEVSDLVARNISAAGLTSTQTVKFVPLDWEADLLPPQVTSSQQRDGGSIDLVIAAECIYNTDTIPALVNTIKKLVALTPDALVLVSRKVRHESEGVFFGLCEEQGLVQRFATAVPLPGKPGYGYGDFAECVDVYLYSGRDCSL